MPSITLKPLEVALERRESLLKKLASEKTDAFRAFWGDSEGIDGLVVDIYGPYAVLQVFEGRFRGSTGELKVIGDALLSLLKLKGVYKKYFLADRSNAMPDASLNAANPLVGEAAPPDIIVRENGLQYYVRLYDGFSTGLFADQRESRKKLAALSVDKRVLNTFSYTCAFSVACAAAGASHVMSVDVSKKVLEWGTRNAQLNGISLDVFRYREQDAMKFLQRAAQKKENWDLVIVDPPSFARNEKRNFSISKDWGQLVNLASSVVAPGGYLYVSSNFAQWSSRAFSELSAKALCGSGKRMEIDGLPMDYDHQGFIVHRALFRMN